MSWKNIPDNIEDYIGFVYQIYEKDTGMKYIGIKRFWEIEKRKPTKYKRKDGKYLKDKMGKRILNPRTTRRHIKKETSWKDYNTSSPIMQLKLEDNPNNYIKTILKPCKTVSDLKAQEAFIQLLYYTNGKWDELYNEVVNLRINIPKSK